jgi:hypothetical protein
MQLEWKIVESSACHCDNSIEFSRNHERISITIEDVEDEKKVFE